MLNSMHCCCLPASPVCLDEGFYCEARAVKKSHHAWQWPAPHILCMTVPMLTAVGASVGEKLHWMVCGKGAKISQ